MYNFRWNKYFKKFSLTFQDAVMKEDLITLIKDAMNQILLERPEQPLIFLQQYFTELKECFLLDMTE